MLLRRFLCKFFPRLYPCTPVIDQFPNERQAPRYHPCKHPLKIVERTTLRPRLPLRGLRSRLALIALNWMQHDLVWILLVVKSVACAPVVANGVGKDIPRPVEIRRRDRSADFGVPLEAVLGVFVPEVEGAVGAGGAEGAVHRVEGYSVHGENKEASSSPQPLSSWCKDPPTHEARLPDGFHRRNEWSSALGPGPPGLQRAKRSFDEDQSR